MGKISRKASLSDTAYNEIKDALCEGRIIPGDILSESQLAADMGMSRTPVREALRALASEGWLEIKNGVGAFVKSISTKDMEDLYEIRCLLETQAARTAVFHITNEEIDVLEARFTCLLNNCRAGITPDPKVFSDLDWELHNLIIQRCQNNYIKSIMETNNSNMKRYQYLSVEAFNDIQESTLQHLHILELLRSRSPDGLAQALQEHLQWAAAFLTRTR